ncbi:DMT family transporter [Psychromarinibacter sp. S121]|uniref:DMT family transporter n=1 Tax=Psychromarinibacter sp. S121 TaxID=3415127 RepID=UPI003C7AF172
MRLFGLVALVMVAFAANSVLNRLAVGGGWIDAMDFALIRVASGAAALSAMVLIRDRRLTLGGPHRLAGVLSLTLYLAGFSAAYVTLDAGAGALILFGGVQVTMFAGAVLAREPMPVLRWIGALVALSGLAWMFWPGNGARVPPVAGAMMAAAAVGWGVYSLVGRRSGEPLRATAANFLLAVPVCAVIALLARAGTAITPHGILLALTSGIVTSGLGYALWYAVLPRLAASVAAVAQLTVPVIALAGGALILSEPVTPALIAACALVLGGVALSVLARR